MKSRFVLLFVGAVLGLSIGLGAAFVIGTNDELRGQVFNTNTGTTVVTNAGTTTTTGAFSNLPAGIRAAMNRENMDTSTYYITEYLNTVSWLEGKGVSLSNDIVDDFSAVDELITTRNMKTFFESPTSSVNTMLSFVFDSTVDLLENASTATADFTDAPIESCLALQSDPVKGRVLYLYIKVPTDAKLDFPDSWIPLAEPPLETEEWKSECYAGRPKK